MITLNRNELVELVEKIVKVEGNEQEIDSMIFLLEKNVPHPEVTDLIYWNENELTSEQIVDIALSYRLVKL